MDKITDLNNLEPVKVEFKVEQNKPIGSEFVCTNCHIAFNALIYVLGKTSCKPIIKYDSQKMYIVDDALIGLDREKKGLESVTHIKLEISNGQTIYVKCEDIKAATEDDLKKTFYIRNDGRDYVLHVYEKECPIYNWYVSECDASKYADFKQQNRVF